MLAFVEPRILKINKDHLGAARGGIIASIVFYAVLALLLRCTVMRTTLHKDHISLVKREVEMQRRPSVSYLSHDEHLVPNRTASLPSPEEIHYDHDDHEHVDHKDIDLAPVNSGASI